MSTSPPKEPDVEQSAQSGEEQDHMDREPEGAQGTGLGEFEVKEQDRWLPIANGWFYSPFNPPQFNFPGEWTALCLSFAMFHHTNSTASTSGI